MQVSAPKRAALGFFAGVKALFGGLGFVVTTPSAWPWASVPVFVASTLFFGIATVTVWGGHELAHRMLWDQGDGTWTMVGIWALRVLFYVLGVLLAFVVAMTLAQPISGFALERLARKQEIALNGRTWPDQPFVASTFRSLRVSVTALVIGLPILGLLALITFLAPPAGVVTIPLKFIVTGVLAVYDLVDYPLSLRGLGVRARVQFIKDEWWACFGFGCAVAALLLIPGFGLFLLPFGVAGATRLVVEADRRRANALDRPHG